MKEIKKGYAKFNEINFWYEIHGSGIPVVFIHAGIASSKMWDTQIDEFCSKYKVIRYDMRGFGKTKPIPGIFSHTEDLYQLLIELKIEKAHLIGCSKGGSTAFDFAAVQPDMVLSVTLVASLPNGFDFVRDGEPPVEWDECIKSFNEGNLMKTAELETQIWVVGRFRTKTDVDMKIFKEIVDLNLIALKNEKKFKMKEKLLTPTAMERLTAINFPLMLIYGDLDDPNLIKGTKLLSEELNAQLKVIKGTAHLPNMEKSKEFNEIVLNFINQIKI